MARRDEKPMLPEVDPGHVQCAADAACRKPGRMFVTGLKAHERLCVNHYYLALERGALDAEPQRRMRGVTANPVAGD